MNGGVDGQAIKFCSVLSLLTAPFFGSLALSEIWSIAALLRIVQWVGHMQSSSAMSRCPGLEQFEDTT